MKICEEPRFVEIFKMVKEFFSEVDWKLSKWKQGNQFPNLEHEFWKKLRLKFKATA